MMCLGVDGQPISEAARKLQCTVSIAIHMIHFSFTYQMCINAKKKYMQGITWAFKRHCCTSYTIYTSRHANEIRAFSSSTTTMWRKL